MTRMEKGLWRKARMVLTSNDHQYQSKLEVTKIIQFCFCETKLRSRSSHNCIREPSNYLLVDDTEVLNLPSRPRASSGHDRSHLNKATGRSREKTPDRPETLKGASVVPLVAMMLKAGGQAGSGVREAAGRE
jgi:hypothetical protein